MSFIREVLRRTDLDLSAKHVILEMLLGGGTKTRIVIVRTVVDGTKTTRNVRETIACVGGKRTRNVFGRIIVGGTKRILTSVKPRKQFGESKNVVHSQNTISNSPQRDEKRSPKISASTVEPRKQRVTMSITSTLFPRVVTIAGATWSDRANAVTCPSTRSVVLCSC